MDTRRRRALIESFEPRIMYSAGPGPAGLAAMPAQAVREGIVWARPWLDHPREAILDHGGAILFAVVEGVGPVGTCALKPSGGGAIELTSVPGEGSVVSLRIPLTLAIIDGFLLGVGKSSFVVPLSTVVECIEMSRQQASDKDWLDLRGEVLPLVRLRERYDIEGAPGRRQNVVVVQGGGQRVGLVVDQLMGELQTVIKPLGKVFQNVRGVGGFTILGSGAVALLLDVPNLVNHVTRACEVGGERQHRLTSKPELLESL